MTVNLLHILFLFLVLHLSGVQSPEDLHIRINQVGYLPREHKTAILFSNGRVNENYELIDEKSDTRVLLIKPVRSTSDGWGTFRYYYDLDFSEFHHPGTYHLKGIRTGIRSESFSISSSAYGSYQEQLLEFMRQQRCGYNPSLDMVCHQRDGRSFFGPFPDSTYVDVSGGWHDAGDMLKYLISAKSLYALGKPLRSLSYFPFF